MFHVPPPTRICGLFREDDEASIHTYLTSFCYLTLGRAEEKEGRLLPSCRWSHLDPYTIHDEMLLFLLEVLLLGALLLGLVYYFLLLPPRYPQNIPAIPFWVALIPFFKDVDQSDIFRQYIDKPLRTHGAVKIFFGAQWNILVHRPSYLVEIFKDEDLYEKSGNQKKIPHSVLAEFLGDNIISARGDVWKNYRSVIKPGLQRNFDGEIIESNAVSLCRLLRESQKRAGSGGGGVAVQDLLQRYSVSNFTEAVLGTKLHALDRADAPINLLQTAVKREIFKPIFMSFPFLDRLPLKSRLAARRTVGLFKNELKRALQASHHMPMEKTSSLSDQSDDKLGQRMLDARASGMWDEKQLLDNLTVSFVAGQENPQLLMISSLYLLAKHPEAQEALRQEILSKDAKSSADLAKEDMPYLTSLIYECLRLFPPIGQLINRKAAETALLGGDVVIPKGTYVGYHCYSTNRCPTAWGPTADKFDPGRWGSSSEVIQQNYRRRRVRGEWISFHGGKRACLGEKFAMLEMRTTLIQLVREFSFALDPMWVDRKTPVSLSLLLPMCPR
ncbi:cytochrome P450 [Colletotrichum paranaense]|uniref:Cytochrome P450 n=1 Tax=Colletotrichum paranaense TaxID=1914294 RepID=A0ABQ9SKG2_9PEZI|nr:cytochrome P450 [Colletotrichum paranaense]KAK1538382.1 cytochrome P450 [Colletotrichum paranaense]